MSSASASSSSSATPRTSKMLLDMMSDMERLFKLMPATLPFTSPATLDDQAKFAGNFSRAFAAVNTQFMHIDSVARNLKAQKPEHIYQAQYTCVRLFMDLSVLRCHEHHEYDVGGIDMSKINTLKKSILRRRSELLASIASQCHIDAKGVEWYRNKKMYARRISPTDARSALNPPQLPSEYDDTNDDSAPVGPGHADGKGVEPAKDSCAGSVSACASTVGDALTVPHVDDLKSPTVTTSSSTGTSCATATSSMSSTSSQK